MSARPLRGENALAPTAEACQGPAVTSLLDDMVDAHARWNAARLADWYPHEQRRARSREAMQGQAGWVADDAFGLAFRVNGGSVPVAAPLAWANRRIDLPDGHWSCRESGSVALTPPSHSSTSWSHPYHPRLMP